MWYEILPVYLIITFSLAAPAYLAAAMNQLVFGKMYRRALDSEIFRSRYLRDRWISGVDNPYVIRGLEAIDDESGGDGGHDGGVAVGEQDVEREQCPANFDQLSDEDIKKSGKVPQEEVCKAPQ